jgi:hypothetical protein
LELCIDLIANRIKTRHWLLFILLTAGLILSLVGLALWRGEQNQVNAENFRLVFSLSILGSVIFGVLLVVGALYLRSLMKR